MNWGWHYWLVNDYIYPNHQCISFLQGETLTLYNIYHKLKSDKTYAFFCSLFYKPSSDATFILVWLTNPHACWPRILLAQHLGCLAGTQVAILKLNKASSLEYCMGYASSSQCKCSIDLLELYADAHSPLYAASIVEHYSGHSDFIQ